MVTLCCAATKQNILVVTRQVLSGIILSEKVEKQQEIFNNRNAYSLTALYSLELMRHRTNLFLKGSTALKSLE